MVKKNTVPDAWDDDWESQVKHTAAEAQREPEQEVPLSRSERLNKHNEANRKLWESAQSHETFHFLETANNVPAVTSNFKPQVKVLSRNPVIAKRDPVTGMSKLAIDDEEEEPEREVQLTAEEIRAKQKRDREEKQRRYEEARAKIFGESAPSSRGSSPGTTTPPRSDSRYQGQGRGRGRGGQQRGNTDNRQFESRRQIIQPTGGRELYDPNSLQRPDSAGQRSLGDGAASPRRIPAREDQQQQPIRSPRGPDGTGKGGFGFAQRGARDD